MRPCVSSPPINLVAEVMEMSAPSSSGRWYPITRMLLSTQTWWAGGRGPQRRVARQFLAAAWNFTGSDAESKPAAALAEQGSSTLHPACICPPAAGPAPAMLLLPCCPARHDCPSAGRQAGSRCYALAMQRRPSSPAPPPRAPCPQSPGCRRWSCAGWWGSPASPAWCAQAVSRPAQPWQAASGERGSGAEEHIVQGSVAV